VFGVLEIHLSGKYTGEQREYLAGAGKGKYSVADMGTWREYHSPPFLVFGADD
jgi:glutathione S-transferase